MTPSVRAPVLLPGLATGIGSLPYTDARHAAESVLRCLPELPAVPQLPARDPREGMLAQWLGALPEVAVAADGSLAVRGTSTHAPECVFDESAHAGLLAFVEVANTLDQPLVRAKVQVTGPLTLGVALHVGRFRGRGPTALLVNAGMALPPVVVGLLVMISLWRTGPLGALGWLFTPMAMVIAQVIVALPLIAGFTRAAISLLDPDLVLAMRADGGNRGGRHARLAQQRGHAGGVDLGQCIGRQGLAVDLVLARLLQGAVCGAQRLGEGFAGGGQYLRPRAAEIDQHRIGTIHAGAGHDADIAFAAWRGLGHGRRVSWKRSVRCRRAAH